jgi:hypothetical protein
MYLFGQIGLDGFQHSGMLGLGLGRDFRATAFMIHPLVEYSAVIADMAEKIRFDSEARPNINRFGLLLVDGLSMAEERLVANLYQQIGNVPIIGGSAGDDLRFEQSFIYDGMANLFQTQRCLRLLRPDLLSPRLKFNTLFPVTWNW